jgi:hypothetical protein
MRWTAHHHTNAERGTARNPRLSVAEENQFRTPTAGRFAPRCIKHTVNQMLVAAAHRETPREAT